MKYTYFISLLILASATLGSAQFDGLSSNCTTTLTGLLGNSDVNACFPFKSVSGLVTTGGAPDQASLTSAADAICAAPKCSDSVVSQTLSTVQGGCQQEIQNKLPIIEIVDFMLTFYSPTRDSLCLKNSTSGYCFIESEMAVQQIIQSAPANQSSLLTFANAPTSTVCTPCNKAIANTYFNFLNTNPNTMNVVTDALNVTSSQVSDAKSALSGKCGQSFLDGNVGDSTESPQTFQSQLNTKKSDATSLIANNMGFVVLVGSILAMI